MSLLTNLISYWKFDGNANDSADSNNGTVYSTITLDSNGKIRSCYIAPDSTTAGARIEVADNANLRLTNAFTLLVWTKASSTGLTSKYLINKGSSVPESDYAIIYGYTSQKFEFYAEGYTGSNPRTALNTAVNDTNWHLIIWTYDGTTLKGYLDGNLDVSATITFSLKTSTSTLTFFASSSLALNQFVGRIDEPAIWSRALSSAEVTQLFNNGLGNQYPFPITGGGFLFNML